MTSTATRLLPDRGAGGRFVKRSLPNFPHYGDLVAELGFDPLGGREPDTDEIATPLKRDTKEIPVEPQTDTIRVIKTERPSPR